MRLPAPQFTLVVPALDAGIHVLIQTSKTWMAGTSPAMTNYFFAAVAAAGSSFFSLPGWPAST
jgi:hypothetical protein